MWVGQLFHKAFGMFGIKLTQKLCKANSEFRGVRR